jgi:type IV secretory pathway VirB10-like protein
MSLINDALKRASQSEKNRPRDAGLPSAMQPVPESRRSIVPAVTGVAIVALLAAAGWFVWRSLPHRDNRAPAPVQIAASPVAPAPPAKVEPAPLPAVASAKEGAPVVVTPPPNTNPPAPPAAPAVAPAPAAAPPPFPELKLQGIFYNRTNPRAAINGEIRRENEQIGEVRIVTITSNKVTVEWNGQTRDLNLGGQ